MIKESDLDAYLEKLYNKPIDRILKEDAPAIKERMRVKHNYRASEEPILNKTKTKKMQKGQSREISDGRRLPSCEVTSTVTNMKPKGGTAKPSGTIGKGGPAKSPTDGKSLKVKGGKAPKKGK
jgi:hypothetical protein